MENFPPNFVEDFLKLHNKYRAFHNSPPLKIDDELNELAQEWAERLARKGILQYKSDPKYGENIYISPWRNLPYDIKPKDPLESWYREGDYYKYGDDDAKGMNGVCNFTQLVWKDTKSIGLGIAIAINGAFYFVCFYYPCGNIVGQFKENVLPPIKEEKELTPEEAEFIQKIKSKINVVRSMERLYAVPSEQLRVWLIWLSKVGDMADEWHKWLRSHIDFVLRLSIELRAAEEVLTLEQEKEEEIEKKEIEVETKVETKEIETDTKEETKKEEVKEDTKEETEETKEETKEETEETKEETKEETEETKEETEEDEEKKNANNSGNSNNPGSENSNNPGSQNSNNPGSQNSNNPGSENSNNPGSENSNNPGPEDSNNPGPGNPNDEEEVKEEREEEEEKKEELITEEEEKEEEERREEEEETVVTEIVEEKEDVEVKEEEEEEKPSIVITEEEEEEERRIMKEWPVGIPWEHLGIEEEEEKLFDDRLPIPKNEVEMKDFLRKFTHEATIHRSSFKHWKETADQAVKEIGNRLVMATFLVQGKDQTGEVKKPAPKKVLKKVKSVQKKSKKRKSPVRKEEEVEEPEDSKLEMTLNRRDLIRKMMEVDADDLVKDSARGMEPLPYIFYLKVEPDIDIAIEHDDENVILADTERENITGDYQKLYFNLSDKPCKGGKPWIL